MRVSDDTVRRMLRREDLVWRRPRPVPGRSDPRGAYKLRRIRELLRDLPDDEAAVFQDEVDLNLNPEIGCMWMPRGERAEVVTPGTNVKRYMAGSISWRTGELVETLGDRRDAALFVRHLDELRRRFRRYRVIHVVCDNARFHTPEGSKLVRAYLRSGATGSSCTTCPRTRPSTTRSSGCGGTCGSRSPATTGAKTSRNWLS